MTEALAPIPRLERDAFARGMALLAATYNRELTDVLISAYYTTLEQIDAIDFEGGVREVLRTERFWPTPAVILEAAEGSRTQRIRREREEQERREWEQGEAALKQRRKETEIARAELEAFAEMPEPATGREALRRLCVAATAEGRCGLEIGLRSARVLAYDRRSLHLEIESFYLALGDLAPLATKALPGIGVIVCPSDAVHGDEQLRSGLQSSAAAALEAMSRR